MPQIDYKLITFEKIWNKKIPPFDFLPDYFLYNIFSSLDIRVISAEKDVFKGLADGPPGEKADFKWLRDGKPFDPEERFKVQFRVRIDFLFLFVKILTL